MLKAGWYTTSETILSGTYLQIRQVPGAAVFPANHACRPMEKLFTRTSLKVKFAKGSSFPAVLKWLLLKGENGKKN